MVKNLPLIQETWVWSLGQEDPLEKGMTTHSSILAWETHGQRSLAGCGQQGRKESNTTEWLTLFRVRSVVVVFFFPPCPCFHEVWDLKRCSPCYSSWLMDISFPISQNPITLQRRLCTLSLFLAAASAVWPDQSSSHWSSRLSMQVLIRASTFRTQMFQRLCPKWCFRAAPCDSLPATNNLICLQSAPSWAQTPPFT